MNHRSLVTGLLLAVYGSIPQAHATPNLALGADTSASDDGWGGGSTKSDLVNGLASYYDTWAHGLAAPWGWGEQYFHVVLDFGHDISFNSVVAWWHPDERSVPNNVELQIWNTALSQWNSVFSTTSALATLGALDDPMTWSSTPTAPFTFATVTSDKLRMVFDNAEIYTRPGGVHGWLYEVAVYNENAVPEPDTLFLLGLGLAGLGYGRKCTQVVKTRHP